MGRTTKKDRAPAISQAVLADNVEQLRNKQYAQLPNVTAMNRALAKDAGTTLSQVQRVLSRALAPGVDMVEMLANALHVRPQDLITPYFARSLHNQPTPAVPALKSVPAPHKLRRSDAS